MRPGFPEKCKWNAFTIDSLKEVWKHGEFGKGKDLPLSKGLSWGHGCDYLQFVEHFLADYRHSR